MKIHQNAKVFICSICGKDFYTKWRLEKHVVCHSEMGKFCHYFNNGKTCPFYELGCKFRHEEAENCSYDKKCKLRLCQFKHSLSDEKIENIDKDLQTIDDVETETDNLSDVEDSFEESEDDSLTDDENVDYEEVNDKELKENYKKQFKLQYLV